MCNDVLELLDFLVKHLRNILGNAEVGNATDPFNNPSGGPLLTTIRIFKDEYPE
jgi:hypothetical protein